MMHATCRLETAGAAVWDALVIGAGPAGALAARQLAVAGARVLLVEKKAFPRKKVCGCCLNSQALAVLDAVGLPALVSRAGGIPLKQFHLALASHELRVNLPEGAALSRDRLDAALAQEAIAAGAEFLAETQAVVAGIRGDAREVALSQADQHVVASARIVLVAAGLAHQCLTHEPHAASRAVPGSRFGAGCAVKPFPEFYHQHTIFMAAGRGGYVGLVQIEGGQLNVAAAFEKTLIARHLSPGLAAAALLAEAGFPPVPGLEDAAWQGTSPLTRRPRTLASERVFLIGDASGYVEPFTGEGMGWALASAQAVAPVALRGIAGWDPALPKTWTSLHRSLIGRRQHLCRAFAQILRRPRLARALLQIAGRAPIIPRLMIERVNAPFFSSEVNFHEHDHQKHRHRVPRAQDQPGRRRPAGHAALVRDPGA